MNYYAKTMNKSIGGFEDFIDGGKRLGNGSNAARNINFFQGFVEVKSSIAFLPLALYLFLFFLSLFPLLFFPPAFTCRVVAAVSKGEKKLIESIEAKRKLTTTGWLVLLFCLETNVAISLPEKGGSAFPGRSLNCFVFLCTSFFPCSAFFPLCL